MQVQIGFDVQIVACRKHKKPSCTLQAYDTNIDIMFRL